MELLGTSSATHSAALLPSGSRVFVLLSLDGHCDHLTYRIQNAGFWPDLKTLATTTCLAFCSHIGWIVLDVTLQRPLFSIKKEAKQAIKKFLS